MALKRKIAYINLTTGEITKEAIPVKMRELYLGGRGIDAYLAYNYINPRGDPLGPGNVALISAGLLGGTLASASARTHVGGKSPLTGFFGSCNMGGFFAPEMRFAGFDHLVIKGRAKKPVYLWIHNGEIEIRDAKNVWGKTIPEAQQAIRDELGDREIKVLTIGPAGEKLVRFANVMTSLKNAGGRTGMGAVLGSKNLKAVAARGTMDIGIAHPQEALDYDKAVITQITSSKVGKVMQTLGTLFIWGATNSTGLVRVRNFQLNQLTDCEDIEAESLEKEMIGTAGCFGCQVHCRGRYFIKDGPYAGTYAEGPEYTSQGAFGGEVDCRDKQTVLLGNHLCNSYGIDILEQGSMVAWAMELYEAGILTNKDTDGLELRFGNTEAVIEMIHRVGRREGLGDILAEGPLRAAAKIGKDSIKYLLHVKGMSPLQSDERTTPALALGLATASRGADHLRSRPAIDLYHLPEPVLRKIYSNPIIYDGPMSSDYRDYVGKPWEVTWQEFCYAVVDSLGICKYHTLFLSPNFPNFDEWSRLIYYNTGLQLSPLDLWRIGERISNMERLFNVREGLTRNHDWLPDQFFDQPAPIGLAHIRGLCLDREKFNKMIDEYYQHHGWDENGVPTPETLKRLGIDKEPSHML